MRIWQVTDLFFYKNSEADEYIIHKIVYLSNKFRYVYPEHCPPPQQPSKPFADAQRILSPLTLIF